MSLPIPKRRSGVLHLDGQDIPLRSLTARELTDLRSTADPHAVNIAMISHAFDMTADEAAAWYDAVDAADVLAVLDAINRVSGIGQEAQFPGRTGDDAVDARSAE